MFFTQISLHKPPIFIVYHSSLAAGPMYKYLLLLTFLTCTSTTFAQYELREIPAKEESIRADLQEILKEANWATNQIDFKRFVSDENYALIQCQADQVLIEVYADDSEWGSVLYVALQKMGFYFPHPRIQISPENIAQELCGQKIYWRPALKYRGSHFHTLHPNEWVHAFNLGNEKIAIETINWLARNQQNIFDFSMLRLPKQDIYDRLKVSFQYAKDMGVHAGVTFGVAMQQQNSFKLVSLMGTFFDAKSERQIKRNLTELLEEVDMSFLSAEAGTSEFTNTNYERSLGWYKLLGEITHEHGVQMLAKVHISSNQHHPEYGNYNFLSQYCDEKVGVLPHTVFYYALEDELAPMYGNENFAHMKDFMLQEKDKRMTWFYPETSYYISMDIDVPLMLTEYLRGRAADMKLIYEQGVEGQLNFTTGQELGYWMIDWTVALLNNLEYEFDPLIALKLLGEDANIWQKHLDFQYQYLTEEQLISIVSFSNGGDEFAPSHAIHKRNILRHLAKSEEKTKFEIAQLEKAIPHIPSTDGIQNEELKLLLDITYLRFHHALYTRKALLDDKEQNLIQAAKYREEAQLLMNQVKKKYNRYPSARIFKHYKNPTAYPYGYGAMAANLYHWVREERMIEKKRYSPLFMPMYDFIDILF